MKAETSKEYYIEHLPEGLPIFYQPFYLDVITRGRWEICYYREGDNILASMPYFLSPSRYTLIRQPPFAIYQGPYFSNGRDVDLGKQMEILDSLENSLQPYDYYNQNWHPTSRNWLPFHWKGYHQSTRYTYVIPASANTDQVRAGYNENVRRNLKKASALHVEEGEDFGSLLAIVKATFTRKGLEHPYDVALFRDMVQVCLARRCSSILIARDAGGSVHAGMFIVWDTHRVYYMAGGVDERFKNSGAMTLLFDRAIRFAMSTGRIFDFEGSMIRNIERYFRSFGAVQQEYFVVTKVNSLLLRGRMALAKIHPTLNPF